MNVASRALGWIKGEPRAEPGQDPVEGRRRYWLALKPKTDPIRFIKPLRCTGVWTEPGATGCGHVVRFSFMAPARRRPGLPAPYSAECPICGTAYPFSMVKLVVDDDYEPEREEEADIRAMYADIVGIARGRSSTYDPPFERRVEVHCLTYRHDGSCLAHMREEVTP